MIETKWTTDGSGSTFIWGFMDDGFKENMTRAECEDFRHAGDLAGHVDPTQAQEAVCA